MRYSLVLAAAGLVASVSGHGLVTKVVGANGVEMPGLTVADGTPRDCSSNGCGSQADTAIIRDREIQSGKAGPLGRTQGNGKVEAATMIASFMGGGVAPTNNGTGVGVEDNIPANVGQKGASKNSAKFRRQGGFLSGLLGGGAGGAGGATKAKGTQTKTAAETNVASTAGKGASGGLPTADDNGEVTLQFRQINQDGAGPLEAMIDGTSGGTDMAAFKKAEVTQDVPGFVAGLSTATMTDFNVKVAMPQGMTCEASVGGANNVCVVRVRNNTPAGPFGGSAAFTQTTAARKRAIAYRIKKRAEEARQSLE
ncbi:cell surface protein [Apiospora kogelbergensis]|uniref:Cell surface protein n=1 Tax=Apiospora kogelbergensis TaxID=1337665 RepID=A0AAW0QKU0_9PEZI